MTIKYKIIDNFLSESDFIEMNNNYIQSDFSWRYISKQVDSSPNLSKEKENLLDKVTDIKEAPPIHDWVLMHKLLLQNITSSSLSLFTKILEKIDPFIFWRIQANMTVQQEKKIRSKFHIDYEGKPLENTSLLTSIFYMNTTNGPTLLEDGTEIECKVNRLVTFPYNTFHAVVLCTDQPSRMVINLNYIKEDIL
jgi:hypothetical protein